MSRKSAMPEKPQIRGNRQDKGLITRIADLRHFV
jgi:hypothetical protein